MRDSIRPAFLGGPKAVTLEESEANRWPIITDEDETAVLDVLRSGELSSHPVARELENDFRRMFGVTHAIAHCNGTAALLAAFFALDLRPGDEVIVPSATFWASVVPMLWVGAIPVFAESELERLGLDPADVERKITPRTRAIVVVHLWGMPSKMTELLDIAARHNLKIIEDASHAHGAVWRGRKCGTLGDVGIFSLQSNKLVPAGEGGILLTNCDSVYKRVTCLGDMTRVMELNGPESRFAATTFGMKTRMAPLSAAVARSQLKRLDERNELRNKNIEYLSGRLEPLGFHTFLPPAHLSRVYFEFVVLCDADRIGLAPDLLVAALKAEGCTVSFPRYPLLHQQPLFTEGLFAGIARPGGDDVDGLPIFDPNALPQIETANRRLLRLPAFPSANHDLLDQYASAFEKVVGHAGEINNAAKGTHSSCI